MKKVKLIAVETHPIQYKAPLFRLLAAHPRIDLHVLYAMIPDRAQQGAGFGVDFEWDVPLLSGYSYSLLENVAKEPSVTRFGGCDTPSILSELKSRQPNAVLVNGWVVKMCLQALWACKRLKIPCWVRGEANLLRPRAWWKHAIHRQLLYRYDGYLAIGQANRDFYRFHKCPEDRIGWAPYAIENERFAQAATERAAERAAIRAAWRIPEQAVVFLFSGKLIDKKRPMDILQALALLPDDVRAKAHVLFVGDGPLRSALQAWAAEQRLPVTFAGFINQSRIPDAYVASDVLVLPSDAGETWGLVVNEAMASHVPAVVSTAVGCCRDLVIEGETGYSFSLGDIGTFAKVMQRYVEEPACAREQGARACLHIEKFSLQAAVAGVVDALEHGLSD